MTLTYNSYTYRLLLESIHNYNEILEVDDLVKCNNFSKYPYKLQ